MCGDHEARSMRGEVLVSTICIKVCCILQASSNGWARGRGPSCSECSSTYLAAVTSRFQLRPPSW